MTDVEFRKCAKVILANSGLNGLSLSEALEKQAGLEDVKDFAMKAMPIVKSIGSTVAGRGIKSLGSMMQGIGRVLGADGTTVNGKFRPDMAGKGFSSWIARTGRKIGGLASFLKRDSTVGIRDLKAEGGGWGTAAKWIPGVASGYMMAAPLLGLFGGKIGRAMAAPATFATKALNPMTYVKKGIGGLVSKGVEKATGMVQNMVANQAYDASQQTAYQIANQLANRSPLEHLYGLIDPQGYAAKLYEAAVPQINQKFSDEMAGRGMQNWQPKNLIQ